MKKSNAPRTTFEGFRRLVLKALTDTKRYPNFSGAVRAFQNADALDMFAKDLFAILKACYDLNKTVDFTANRLDNLTSLIKLGGALYVAQLKKETRCQHSQTGTKGSGKSSSEGK